MCIGGIISCLQDSLYSTGPCDTVFLVDRISYLIILGPDVRWRNSEVGSLQLISRDINSRPGPSDPRTGRGNGKVLGDNRRLR